MSISTDFSSTSGATAAAATIIKRRENTQDAPKAFTLNEEPLRPQQKKQRVQEKAQTEPIISDSEKQYFETLFPGASDAVRSYSPYQRTGMKQSVSIGSLVDAKG